MAITFDGATSRIILDTTSITAATIWTAWVDWTALHPQWLIAMKQEGGALVDPTLGLYSPIYFFLENGWRVRPMEANHDLSILGNLAVRGGGIPVVKTLGAYQVNTGYVVPERAQAFSTAGSTGPTPNEIAAAVKAMLMNDPILPVNVKQMNDAEVLGVGSSTDKWRGV